MTRHDLLGRPDWDQSAQQYQHQHHQHHQHQHQQYRHNQDQHYQDQHQQYQDQHQQYQHHQHQQYQHHQHHQHQQYQHQHSQQYRHQLERHAQTSAPLPDLRLPPLQSTNEAIRVPLSQNTHLPTSLLDASREIPADRPTSIKDIPIEILDEILDYVGPAGTNAFALASHACAKFVSRRPRTLCLESARSYVNTLRKIITQPDLGEKLHHIDAQNDQSLTRYQSDGLLDRLFNQEVSRLLALEWDGGKFRKVKGDTLNILRHLRLVPRRRLQPCDMGRIYHLPLQRRLAVRILTAIIFLSPNLTKLTLQFPICPPDADMEYRPVAYVELEQAFKSLLEGDQKAWILPLFRKVYVWRSEVKGLERYEMSDTTCPSLLDPRLLPQWVIGQLRKKLQPNKTLLN